MGDETAPDGEGDGAAARLTTSPGWRRLRSEVLSGVRHEVLGRVSALRSLIRIGRLGQYSTDDLVSMLQEETDRLERPAEWLKALPEGRRQPPEPVSVPDLVEKLKSVAQAIEWMEGVEVRVREDGSWPPVRAEHPELARCMLSLLVMVGAGAPAVRVTGTRANDALRVTVEPVGGWRRERAGEVEGFSLVGAPDTEGEFRIPGAVRSSVSSLGGSLAVEETPGSAPKCVLRLPIRIPGEG